MTGQWAPLGMGALLALGAVLLAGLFEHFRRVYGDRYLRIWSLSWLAGGFHVLLGAGSLPEGTFLPGTGEVARLLTGYAHCLLLVWGVYEAATGLRAPRGAVRGVGVMALGSVFLAVAPGGTGAAGTAYGVVTAAAYTVAGVWLVWWLGSRGLGSVVTGAGLGAHGLLQLSGLGALQGWIGGLEVAAPVVRLMVEFLIALGLVIWLLQEAGDRAVRRAADRHEAQQASLRRFRRLLEKGWDIVELRRPDGSVEWVSGSVERVLGIGVNDYLSASPFDLVHPDDRGAMSRLMSPGSGRAEPVRVRMAGGDGRVRNMEAVSVDLSDDPEVGAIVVTSRDVTERHRLQRDLVEASGRERRELGRELHDGLGQVLTGIGFRVAQLEGALRQQPGDVPALAGEIKALVRTAVTQADSLARGLSPVSMRADGMATALEALTESIGSMHGVECTVGALETDVSDPSVANQLYMIAEEAALTAVRSHGYRRIEIGIERSGDGGVLYVRCGRRLPGRGVADLGEGRSTRERILHYRASVIDAALEVVGSGEGERTVLCRFRQATASEGLSEAG